jgi:hypothetical protein
LPTKINIKWVESGKAMPMDRDTAMRFLNDGLAVRVSKTERRSPTRTRNRTDPRSSLSCRRPFLFGMAATRRWGRRKESGRR